MAVPQFDVQFARVGEFVRSYQNVYGSGSIRVFSDFIQVDFRTHHVVRRLPEGYDEMHLFAENDALVIRCSFYFQEEKEG